MTFELEAAPITKYVNQFYYNTTRALLRYGWGVSLCMYWSN